MKLIMLIILRIYVKSTFLELYWATGTQVHSKFWNLSAGWYVETLQRKEKKLTLFWGTAWCKILTGENIDEFDEFLSICQHFPHQTFPLIIFSVVCIPDHFFTQGVIASYITRAHAILFPACSCKYINGKTVIYIAMQTTACIPKSKVASYIASN